MEDSSDARYFQVDSPTLVELGRNSSKAFVVRADELMSAGYLPVGRLDRQLAHFSPWREWSLAERKPAFLAEYWAGFGAPAELVDELLSNVSSVKMTADALVVQRDNVQIQCSLPLQPDALSRVPELLRPFVRVHAKVVCKAEYLSLGWKPRTPRVDPAEYGVIDGFHFFTAGGGYGFVVNERIELVDEYEERWPCETPLGELILDTILRSPNW